LSVVSDLLIRNIGLLVTAAFADRDDPRRRVARIPRAAILIQDGRLALMGPEPEIARRSPSGLPELDANGALATPGLVDCHTHPVFVGNRAHEFHLRNTGKTYPEIAAAGGGIQATARKVREAPVEQIIEESLPRFHRSLTCGVTTIEAKSGYGLDWAGERKLLEALKVIEGQVPQRVVRTLLIHALPETFAGSRERFVREVEDVMIPAAAQEGLASAVDVFCETGAFSVEESRAFLRAAERHGMLRMIHANQFGHSGGAWLAAELGVCSAHHLEHLNGAEIDALAKAGVVAVMLPASVFFLGTLPYPPARHMIERGLRVAVATDMNPGSSMTESLPFCMTAAAIYGGMTPEELLWGATLDAARAIGVEEHAGSLEIGREADVCLWSVPDLESLSYHFGELRAAAVVIGGNLVWRDSDATRRY
jgi:imidazolonepropionase